MKESKNNFKTVLIGPPFSGKTTILNALKEQGYSIFNSDEYVKEIYQKDKPGYILIKEDIAFGKDYVNEFEVDRKKLGDIVSKDYQKFLRLNELIHPLIEEKYLQKHYDFAEIPLVVLTKLNLNYDKIIVLKPKNKDVIEQRIKNSKRKINLTFINFILDKWDYSLNFENVIEFDTNSKIEDLLNYIKNI